MRRVCVFAGSSLGARTEYQAAAEALGRSLVERDYGLVYGGAHVGLMGAIAEAVLAGDGEVIGVIPQALADREVAHTGLSDLRIVGSMHERKRSMADLADGFVALPGGLGTIEELFEMLTWSQLGLHAKPVGFLNVCGYYDDVLRFLEQAVTERFLKPVHRSLMLVESDPGTLLDRLEHYDAPTVTKWIGRDMS